MDYESIYYKLVESRKNRILDINENYERHHIIPVSWNGNNDKNNIVSLTYREHLIAHKLLFLFSTGKRKTSMGYALHKMCTINNNSQQYRISSAREFEKIKKEVYSYIRGENHPNYGRKMSDESRKKCSESKLGDKNPFYGKKPWNYGLTKDTSESIKRGGKKVSKLFKEGKIDTSNYGPKEEGRKRISEALLGKPKSEEHRRKISEVNKGKILSLETRKKMSESRKGVKQKLLKCPHCNKEGGTTMYRWHFDKCKYKKE